MSIEFSPDQLSAIENIKNFLTGPDKTLLFQGSAGTGKTSVINYIFQLPEYSKKSICLSATTNKAVAVIEAMSSIECDNIEYSTLHKLLKTKRVIDVNGEPQFVVNNASIFAKSKDKNKKTINSFDIVVIDEASMISSSVFDSLMKVISRIRGKIIFTGDRCQLNPVNEDESSVFSLENNVELTQIHRACNGILGISNHIRESVENTDKIKIKKWCDNESVFLIKNRQEWFKKFVELNILGMEPIVLAYTNSCCKSTNDILRSIIFKNTPGFEGQRFIRGDRIVFNNPYKSNIEETTSNDEIINHSKIFHTSEQTTVKNVETNVKSCKPLTKEHLLSPYTLDMIPKHLKGVRLCSVCKTKPMKAEGESGCFHVFCPDCYLTWIHQAKECPLCCIDNRNDEFKIHNRRFKALEPLLNKFLRFTKNTYKVWCLEVAIEDKKSPISIEIEVVHEKSLAKFNRDTEILKGIIADIKAINNTTFIHTIARHLWEYYYREYLDTFADVSYGYCITSHKSQGSTYSNVFVDIGNILNYNRTVVDGLKCVYTSVTRPSQELYLTY